MPDYEQSPEEINKQPKGKNAIPPGFLTLREFKEQIGRSDRNEMKNPTKEQITQTIREAFEGSHKLRITFKKEATMAVSFLLEMVSSGIIRISDTDRLALMNVAESGDWRNCRNRTFLITIGDNFDEGRFIGRLERGIEKIEAVR